VTKQNLMGTLLVVLTACTPGGMTPPSGGSAVTTIDVNLTQHASVSTSAGTAGGYSPIPLTVAVGSTIRFMNSDSFSHTATLIPNATTFPNGSPFTVAAQTQSGTAISQSWSSGTLVAGSSSQSIVIDKAGTYLYGCFFHYGSPMRGMIVAQ